MPTGILFAGLSNATIAALGVIGCGALIALYLVRRRPRTIVVPFAGLWFTSDHSQQSERRARRLRQLVSLALQLVMFGCVLFAAGDPQFGTGHDNGRTIAVLIDRSASMQATDESGSRLERARQIARQIVDQLAPGDRAVVVPFATTADAASGIDRDPGRLRAAVDTVAASDQPGDLPGALRFAASVLRGQPRRTIIVISDGGTVDVDDPATIATLTGIDLRFQAVGQRRDNLALVSFSARRVPGDPSSVELAWAAQSFRTVPADVWLTVTSGSAHIPVARRRVRLAPGARVTDTITGVAIPDVHVQATLDDAHDDLSLDDRAFAVVPQAHRLNVLVVGDADLYLDGALLGLSGDVHVDHALPTSIDTTRPRWSTYDVVVFDGVTPNPAPTAGRFLYLDPHGVGSPWRDQGAVSDPVVTDVARDHPLCRQLNLRDLNVVTARQLSLGLDDRAIVSALRTPLIIARDRPDLRAVAVAFDPRASDLPLRSAFPLLVSNVLDWLANSPAIDGTSWPTGRTVSIPLALDRGRSGTAVASVRTPDGQTVSAPVVAGQISVTLDRTGFFDVFDSNQSPVAHVASNLASPAESDLGPRQSAWRVGTTTALPPDFRLPPRRFRPWRLALLIALIIGVAEWFTFHRRWTA
jgi:hypothetical protein